MHHVIRLFRGNGWRCLGCAFHAFADDLAGVARHAVQSQVYVQSEPWEVDHADQD